KGETRPGGPRFSCPFAGRYSESKFCRQLNSSRPAATEEWVADSNVAGGRDCKRAVSNFPIIRTLHETAPATQVYVCRRIRDERRQFGIRKVWVIQKVEEVRPELD